MARKRTAQPAELSRLKVLAQTDERAFLDLAIELLHSRDRLAREAAVEALAEHPLAAARPSLRELYDELDSDGLKLDQGARMRVAIVRSLKDVGDIRDCDIAARACATTEVAFGEDITWQLRVHGLRMIAELSPELFPFYAVERLDDHDPDTGRGEPANTAFQLLAGTGQFVPIYQWLLRSVDDARLSAVFELFLEAPAEIIERYVLAATSTALRRQDEALLTLLAEAIVNHELSASYGVLPEIMSARISEELYNYVAVLLAGTNRRPLLEILEEQLHSGRRPKVIAAALSVRPTPEQEAILRRWEDGD